MLRYTCLILLLFIAIAPASAQPEGAAPLLEMLALVPDTAASHESLVSYADYRALEAARAIDTPPTAQEALLNGVWMAALGGVSSGIQLASIVPVPEEMAEAVGFTFLDIDRSLVFGNPPGMGTILAGDFDTQAIDAAYWAAGYKINDFDLVTVYCGAAGCDAGMQVNIQNRNPANPFGGALGRQEPLAILSGLLANSPDIGVVQSMLDAFHGKQNSLADAPDYRAIALAAAEKGRISQIQFVNPLELMTLDPAALLLDADGIARLRALTSGFEPLAPYTLAAIADVWDGSEQQALILLAYGDNAAAQSAADELARRMEVFVPLSTGTPFSERLAGISGAVDAPEVYTDAETGTAVAVWSVRYPVPPNEAPDGERLTISSLGFRFLIDALYRRDLYVLALEPILNE